MATAGARVPMFTRAARRIALHRRAPRTEVARTAPELSDRRYSDLLADTDQQERIRRFGFAAVGQVLDETTLDQLRASYRRFDPLISSRQVERWFTSGAVEDAAVRSMIHIEIGDIVRSAVQPLAAANTRILGSHFHVNPAGSSDGIAPHQDVPLVDESMGSTLNGWIPLTDVTLETGPLCIVAGSHRFGLVDRSLQMGWAYDGLDQVFREFAVPVPVPAGHLILFDGAAVHCSGPNRSHDDRVAVNFHIAPAGDRVYHVAPVADDPGSVDEYAIDSLVFHDVGPGAVSVADAAQHLGRRPVRRATVDPDELRELCHRGAALC